MLMMLAWVARARTKLEQLMLMMLAWVARARAKLEQLMLMMLARVCSGGPCSGKLEQLGWPALGQSLSS